MMEVLTVVHRLTDTWFATWRRKYSTNRQRDFSCILLDFSTVSLTSRCSIKAFPSKPS